LQSSTIHFTEAVTHKVDVYLCFIISPSQIQYKNL